jgi:23S rRNA pseudouridine1911/1915/1917 synthase
VRVLGQQGPQGRPARTHYRPIAGYRGFTLLEVKIHTGVMHQIRAHLAAEGHPIVGDAVYGKGACLPIDVPRHLLHAASIEVTHPVRGERLRIESPLPRDFSEVLAGLANDKPATPRGCC